MKLLSAIAAMLLTTGISLSQETLRYSINWPTGLSLGEAEMNSNPSSSGKDVSTRQEFQFRLDASIPGFAITDFYRSLASAQFCSIEFEKQVRHGSKQTEEKTTFHPEQGIATRWTERGGKSDIPVSQCAKDGLTFLYWLRDELQRGRLPAPQTILFGAPYRLSLRFSGAQEVLVSEKRQTADRLEAVAVGPKSNTRFDLFFSRGPERKLLMVRVPFAMGTFSMELVE